MSSTVIKTFRSQLYGDIYQFRYVKDGSAYDIFVESHPPSPKAPGCVYQLAT